MVKHCLGISLTTLAGAALLTLPPAFAKETVAMQETPGIDSIAQTAPLAITNVLIEETATGFTLRLVTEGELTAPETSVSGNAAISTIANAVLQLPDEFLVSNPTDGIALITVTNVPDNQVQIVITGTDAPPVIDIVAETSGLTLSATPGDSAAPDDLVLDDSLRITVTGEQEGYLVPDASTATRTDTPLRDVPQSIQVIPRQVIEDQQAIGIEEVLENAAGVTFLSNTLGRGLQIGIRGFDAPILRDGFAVSASGGDFAEPETANLERVEVLRGPASILYGQADPGGVINLVTKKPLSEPYYNFQLQGGNRDFISPSIDLSGPLTEDGSLLYRLNALYRQEDSFRDFDNSFERFFIAPSLTWLISDSTDLTVNLEYTEDNEPIDYGIPAFEGGVPDIPLDRVGNNPEDTIEQDYLNIGYSLEHRFSENWKLRNRFRYSSTSYETSVIEVPVFLDDSTGILNRFPLVQDAEFDTYALYTNVQGKFDTGPVQHTLLFGVDLARSETTDVARFDFFAPSPINIFDGYDLGLM